jgi:hypothetical protein
MPARRRRGCPRSRGEALDLTGPIALTGNEIARILGESLRDKTWDVRFVSPPLSREAPAGPPESADPALFQVAPLCEGGDLNPYANYGASTSS